MAYASAKRAIPLIISLITSILMTIPADAAMEDALTKYTLPNGMTVLVKKETGRKVVALQLWVRVGSADEDAAERGISHLIEHMAFKGTERRGVGQIAAEVEALGGSINAYTSWDDTVFHITVPSSAVTQGLDILVDAVFNPVIDATELAREKEVVLEEILEGDERPERKAGKLLFHTAYEKSPYRYPIIGYREIVEKFTRDDIIAFRKKWYVPENTILIVVGDVDAQKLRSDIEKLTANLKPTAFFRPPRPVEPKQRAVRGDLARDENAREARLHLAFHVPALSGPDVNALDLAADILGSRESSRLVRVLKKERRLVNSISASCMTPREPGVLVISATLDADKMEQATQTVMEELKGLMEKPPEASELERAKTHIESEHVYARETVGGMARALGSYESDAGDALYAEKYLKLNAAVTPDQVSKVVGDYLMAPNATITALVPEKAAPGLNIAKLTDIVKRFTGPKTAQEAAVAAGKTVEKTFPNGLRVALTPDDSNSVVSFKIACLGGQRFETKENQGVTSFVVQMLTKGAGNLDEAELFRRVEDMGGRLTGFSGYDSFGLSGTFFSRDALKGLDLLAMVYASPTFPEAALERERNLILNKIKTEPDRPVHFAVKKLNAAVFKSHPYGFDKDGTLATVSGFTREDLIDFYRKYAVPANMVVTGVGSMDVEKTMKKIEELFGSLPAKPFEPPQVPKEAAIEGMKEEVIKIPRAKAHLMIGFRGTDHKDPERYALDVLNNILAGQGGRLFTQLRDKESLGYVVTSFARTGVDPGVFALYMACDVSKVDQAVQGLIREIKQVREKPVSREELGRSINNLVGNHVIALQSSWARAENVALNLLYGLGTDYESKYIAEVGKVTPDRVQAAARKFLDLKRCVLVKILPEESNEGAKAPTSGGGAGAAR
jgi:zinc protease